jgi:biopolymer transport protein ExbB
MRDIWMAGGPVLWVILVCGVVGFIVYVERSLHLHRARIRYDDFLAGLYNVLKRDNIEEAIAICRETEGPVSQLVRTAIMHRNDGRDSLREAVEDAAVSEISRLERRLVVVSTVAQVTPLLGLLGTVLGFIEFLAAMQQLPLVQASDVMGGMMHALITTAAGLCVAIPAYVSFNLLSGA